MTTENNEINEIEAPKKRTRRNVTDDTSSTNLKEFALLKDEVRRGRMPDRKKEALLSRLTSLYNSKLLDDNEMILFIDVLTKERNKGVIKVYHSDILNKHETADCSDECYVKTNDAPPVLGLIRDTICKYKFDADKERYIVYVPKVIAGEAQLSMAQAIRKNQGHELDPLTIPKDRLVYRRLNLNLREFEKWFGYDDDTLIGNTVKEKSEYTF